MEQPLKVRYPIGQYPAEDRMLIIVYELGGVCRNLFGFLYTDAEKSQKAYSADLKLELADLMYQLITLAHEFGWTIDELIALGTQHFVETKKDLESGRREA
jgi:NTP pyrophosphatase (non-canonical NTP hydrolase)